MLSLDKSNSVALLSEHKGFIINTLDSITQTLRSRGFRTTPIRNALVTTLVANHTPLAIGDLSQLLAQQNIHPNKTTLYREIYFLEEQGILTAIDFGDGKKRYELAEQAHHHHLVCNACGMIEDVVLENDIAEEKKKIAAVSKFKITNHSLEFFGLCPGCQVEEGSV